MSTKTAGGTPSSLRKNHGRGHSYWIDGEKVPGVTTALGAGYPKRPPEVAAEESAWHAVANWDELAELPEKARWKRIYEARFNTQKTAGAARHARARVRAGSSRRTVRLSVDVPDGEYVAHVDSYFLAFVDRRGSRPSLPSSVGLLATLALRRHA